TPCATRPFSRISGIPEIHPGASGIRAVPRMESPRYRTPQSPIGQQSEEMKQMRVLFTGADGYIGAVLGPRLLEHGYDAIGIDTGLYRRGWLFDDGRTRPMV